MDFIRRPQYAVKLNILRKYKTFYKVLQSGSIEAFLHIVYY